MASPLADLLGAYIAQGARHPQRRQPHPDPAAVISSLAEAAAAGVQQHEARRAATQVASSIARPSPADAIAAALERVVAQQARQVTPAPAQRPAPSLDVSSSTGPLRGPDVRALHQQAATARHLYEANFAANEAAATQQAHITKKIRDKAPVAGGIVQVISQLLAEQGASQRPGGGPGPLDTAKQRHRDKRLNKKADRAELKTMHQLGNRLSHGRPTYTRSFHPGSRYAVNPDNPVYADPGGGLLGEAVSVALATVPELLALRGAGFIGAGVREAAAGGAETAAGLGARAAARAANPGIIARGLTRIGQSASESAAGRAAVLARARLASAAEEAAATRTGAAAASVARGVGKTAKIGGKVVSFPIRHPVKLAGYQALAQVPVAATSGDPVGKLNELLQTGGVVGQALTSAGNALSDLSPALNIARDALDLPAQAIPAIYMPVAALINASQGNPAQLDALWKSYEASGLLPAIAQGDPSKILAAIKNHPLFAALELRGAQAIVGRGAGYALRKGIAGEEGKVLGSQAREPLRQPGGRAPKLRHYSGDIIEKRIQMMADQRREQRMGGQIATPRQARRTQRERIDRFRSAAQGGAKHARDAEMTAAFKARPRGKVNQDAVYFAVKGWISKHTFKEDLAHYGRVLRQQQTLLKNKLAHATTSLDRRDLQARIAANEKLQGRLEDISKKGDAEAIFKSAGENVPYLRANDAELVDLGLIDPQQAAQSRMIEAARIRFGARFEDVGNGEQLVDSHGVPLPPAKLEALLKEHGVEQTGFVSSSPSARGRGSFYRPFSQGRQMLPKAKLRGEAAIQGIVDHNYDAIIEQRARSKTVVLAVKNFDRMLSEFAVGTTERTFTDSVAARKAAMHPEEYGFEPGTKLTPVRMSPLFERKLGQDRAREFFHQNEIDLEKDSPEIANEKLWDHAVGQKGEGPFILMPATEVKRFRDHAAAAGNTRRFIQLATGAWKRSILAASPSWIPGNYLDVTMRLGLSGTGLYGTAAGLGRRIDASFERQHGTEEAQRMRGALQPGQQGAAVRSQAIHRDASQYVDTWAEVPAQIGTAIREVTPVKQAIDGYLRLTDKIFDSNAKFIEHKANQAALGKVAQREIFTQTGKWHRAWKMTDEAVDQYARGLIHTPEQIQAAKAMESMLGQWVANSPGAKAFLVDFAPFGQWSRAALRFAYITLPAKHPIATALAAIGYEMTQEERDKLGLSWFSPTPLTPNAQGAIPLGGYDPATGSQFGGAGFLPVGKFTTFGTAGNPAAFASSILPQADLNALAGIDAFGQPLVHSDGTPVDNPLERLGLAIRGTLEAQIPGLPLLLRATGQQGTTAQGTSAFLPARIISPSTAAFLRGLHDSRQLSIPAHPAPAVPDTSANPWMATPSGTNPWLAPSSSTNPWLH